MLASPIHTEFKENLVHNLKVLIAEDDEVSEVFIMLAVRKITRELLKARSGNEAIEMCRLHPDIDLIMMDIKMPDLDGYEVTRQIRQFNPHVVIIAQTAFALRGDRENAISAGCNDHITKPINKTKLIAMINKHVGNYE